MCICKPRLRRSKAPVRSLYEGEFADRFNSLPKYVISSPLQILIHERLM
jgi:hypothetical protein